MGSLGKRRYREDLEEKHPAKKRYVAKSRGKGVYVAKPTTEMKSVDLGATALSQLVTSTMARQPINAIIAGNGIQNRNGRRIQMKSVRVIGQVVLTQAGTAPTSDFVRVMVVYDRQANGAIYSSADLLQSVDQAGTTGSDVFSGINMSNSKRFKVLKNEMWSFPVHNGVNVLQQSTQDTDYKPHCFDWFIPLKGLETQYNTGNAGTIADIQTGSLYILFLSKNAIADSQYSVVYNCRLRFMDA